MSPPLNHLFYKSSLQTAPGDKDFSSKKILTQIFSHKMPRAFEAQWESLELEKNPQLFYSDLWNFAIELEDAGQVDLAMEVYRYFIEVNPESPWTSEAGERLKSFQGTGSKTVFLEYQSKRFLHEATRWDVIVPMTAASSVFRLVKWGTTSRLFKAGPKSFLNSRLGGNLLASGVGLVAETSVFSLSTRWIHSTQNPDIPWDAHSLGKDWLRCGLTLGLLKGAGFLGQQGKGLIANINKDVNPQWVHPVLMGLIGHGSGYLGLVVANQVDVKLGWSEATGLPWLNALSSYMALSLGGSLGQQILGKGNSLIHRPSLPVDGRGNWPIRGQGSSWSVKSPGWNPALAVASANPFSGNRIHSIDLLSEVVKSPNFGTNGNVPITPIENRETDVPIPRKQQPTRTYQGLRVFSLDDGVPRKIQLLPNLISENPLPREAVFQVVDIQARKVTLTLAQSPHKGSIYSVPHILNVLWPQNHPINLGKTYRLDLEAYQASNDGSLHGEAPLEIPFSKKGRYALGALDQLRRWYHQSPTHYLASYDWQQRVDGTSIVFLEFSPLNGSSSGSNPLIIINSAEAKRLGLNKNKTLTEDDGFPIGLVIREPGNTYEWGAQRAARLEVQVDNPFEVKLYLDDLASVRDHQGKESPFLILGRGAEAFGNQIFSDPRVSRAHVQLSWDRTLGLHQNQIIWAENISSSGERAWMVPGDAPHHLPVEMYQREFSSRMLFPIRHGQYLQFGDYNIQILFKRGLESMGGILKPADLRPLNNTPNTFALPRQLKLQPGAAHTLGRHPVSLNMAEVPLRVSVPFLENNHGWLFFLHGDHSEKPRLLVHRKVFSDEWELAIDSLGKSQDRNWENVEILLPELAGADRDLVISDPIISGVSSGEIWVRAQGKTWNRLKENERFILEGGDWVAFGRLHPGEILRGQKIINGAVQLGMVEIPPSYDDCLVYRFDAEAKALTWIEQPPSSGM